MCGGGIVSHCKTIPVHPHSHAFWCLLKSTWAQVPLLSRVSQSRCTNASNTWPVFCSKLDGLLMCFCFLNSTGEVLKQEPHRFTLDGPCSLHLHNRELHNWTGFVRICSLFIWQLKIRSDFERIYCFVSTPLNSRRSDCTEETWYVLFC